MLGAIGCQLPGENCNVRSQADAEPQLPLRAIEEAVELELLLLSTSDRRRAMRNASSSSSGEDELESFLTSASQSIVSDSLPDLMPW